MTGEINSDVVILTLDARCRTSGQIFKLNPRRHPVLPKSIKLKIIRNVDDIGAIQWNYKI